MRSIWCLLGVCKVLPAALLLPLWRPPASGSELSALCGQGWAQRDRGRPLLQSAPAHMGVWELFILLLAPLSTGQPFLLLKCRDCSAAFCFSNKTWRSLIVPWVQVVNTVKPSALGITQCARAVLSCFAQPLPAETRSSSQHPAFSCPCRFLKSSKYRFSLTPISLIECLYLSEQVTSWAVLFHIW